MADFSSQFLDFLKAYNSGAYTEVTSITPSDPKAAAALEARKNEIYAQYKEKEAIWESVPLAIRDRYSGRPLPQDIMDAAARGEIDTLRALEYDASLKTAEQARERVQQAKEEAKQWTDVTTDAALGVVVAAAAAGYAMDTCHTLAANRQLRDTLLAQTGGSHLMSPEEKNQWLASRQKDRDAIAKDWKENQPEKMLLHMLGLHNRGKSDPKTFARDIAELIQKIETKGRQHHLLEHLKNRRVQAKLRHLKPETLDILKKNILPHIPEKARKDILENIQKRTVEKNKKTQNVNEKPAERQRTKEPIQRQRENQNVRTR